MHLPRAALLFAPPPTVWLTGPKNVGKSQKPCSIVPNLCSYQAQLAPLLYHPQPGPMAQGPGRGGGQGQEQPHLQGHVVVKGMGRGLLECMEEAVGRTRASLVGSWKGVSKK